MNMDDRTDVAALEALLLLQASDSALGQLDLVDVR